MSVRADIAAPAQAAWRVLTDFGRYGQWHPVMSLDGPVPQQLAPGGPLAFRLSRGTAGEQAFAAELTEVTPAAAAGLAGRRPGGVLQAAQLPAARAARVTDTGRWSGTMAAPVIAAHRAALEAEYARTGAAAAAGPGRRAGTRSPLRGRARAAGLSRRLA